MEEKLIKEIMKVFECDKYYAQRIRLSIKEDLPIQGSKPSQIVAIQNFISSKQGVISSVCDCERPMFVFLTKWFRCQKCLKLKKDEQTDL